MSEGPSERGGGFGHGHSGQRSRRAEEALSYTPSRSLQRKDSGSQVGENRGGGHQGVVDGARGQSFLFILDLLDLIQDLMEPRVRIP